MNSFGITNCSKNQPQGMLITISIVVEMKDEFEGFSTAHIFSPMYIDTDLVIFTFF